MPTLRIGSRGSELALWQARHIAALLGTRGHQVEIEIVHTSGDKFTDVALAQIGAKAGLTKGIFTKEIEDALASGRVDLAVHSLKDLPTELPAGFALAAIPTREDPRDAFCSRHHMKIVDLPNNARVGTSSLRRQAQLKAIRPDLDLHPLRGNVDTRLRKLEEGQYDAIVLAAAGLKRLGKTDLIREILPPATICPAAGQGALAIEIRAGDSAIGDHLAFLDDPSSRAAITCERAVLSHLGGGCQVPIGAYAELRDGTLHLQSLVASPDGSQLLRDSRSSRSADAASSVDPARLGQQAAAALLACGADKILQAVYAAHFPVPPQP
jgi:hydroxymethylbilane synthase